MPSTLVGLLAAVYVLIPGYCYYAVRRRTVPTRPVSTVIEGANLLVVAMVANALMLALYGALQAVPWIRVHSSSIVHLLRDAEGYLLQSNARPHGSEDGRWRSSLERRPSRWRSPIASGR